MNLFQLIEREQIISTWEARLLLELPKNTDLIRFIDESRQKRLIQLLETARERLWKPEQKEPDPEIKSEPPTWKFKPGDRLINKKGGGILIVDHRVSFNSEFAYTGHLRGQNDNLTVLQSDLIPDPHPERNKCYLCDRLAFVVRPDGSRLCQYHHDLEYRCSDGRSKEPEVQPERKEKFPYLDD